MNEPVALSQTAEQDARYPSLAGKIAVVTGGASGIGAEIVRRLAGQGVSVGILDLLERDGEQVAASVEGVSGRTAFVRTDVTNIRALQAGIDQVRSRFGPIGILVNNAANDRRHRIEDVTSEEWDALVAVNLKHQFFAAQAVLADMKAARSGSIINLSSTSWVMGLGGMPVYVTSKAAIIGLTRSLARDLGPFGIRVNAVLPGWIMTERQLRLWVTPADVREIQQRQCLKRQLTPEDVARVVVFLASDEAGACTSQSFVVDGGWT